MNLDKLILDDRKSILDALRKIDLNEKGFVLIIVNDILVGTLTDGDIRRSLINGCNLNTRISDIMEKRYEYLNSCDSFEEVVNKFKNKKIDFLPIIDPNGALINVVTKNQLNLLLLMGIEWNYNIDFSLLNEEMLIHEIYNRPWGYYKTVYLNDFAQAKIICVFPKGKLSLQEHKKREEHWVIVKGNGTLTIGESTKKVFEGTYIYIPKGCIHSIENISETENLFISEVQLGTYFGEDDIIRYQDIYNRI